MNKVIKIRGANYQVNINESLGSTCGQCAFYSEECPGSDDDLSAEKPGSTLLCTIFGSDAFFVAEPSKPLVEEFKEAAGSAAARVFTEADVRAAYEDWTGEAAGSAAARVFTEADVRAAYEDWTGEADEADRFLAHVKKFSDPEYQEFLRLKAKFSE